MVDFINTEEDLIKNAKTILSYLTGNDDTKIEYARERFSLGRCFVVIKYKERLLFFPSRFMGYLSNTKEQHDNNNMKHGVETNKVISKLLNCEPDYDDFLENEYHKFCKSILAPITSRKPKFWHHFLTIE